MPVSGNGLRPPFLFLAPQKEKRAAAGPKRKNALARSGTVALRADEGLPSRCRLDLPAFCRPAPDRSFTPSLRRVFSAAVIGVENRMAFAPLLPARDSQRQRRSAQRVSGASPGRRVPQGQRVSVPDRRAGTPTFPRRRQEVRMYADRPAETFFLFHRAVAQPLAALPPYGCGIPLAGTAHSLFDVSKREWGAQWTGYHHSRIPRAADCRPYGPRMGPAEIRRADTQVRPYRSRQTSSSSDKS